MVFAEISHSFSHVTASITDRLYGDESEKDVDFYLRQFPAYRPLQGTTLDIGCGTGRFLLPLIKKGHDCLGIDGSIPMLDLLLIKAKAAGLRPDILCKTFFEYEANGQEFQGITALYVIFFILETEELNAFFRKAHALLSPGGVFLFNYHNLYEVWQPALWSYDMTRAFDRGFVRLSSEYQPIDYLRGIVEMRDNSMVCTDGEAVFDLNTRTIRYYSMTEIILMLEDAGFANIRTYTDLDGYPVTETDTRGLTLYTVAEKS